MFVYTVFSRVFVWLYSSLCLAIHLLAIGCLLNSCSCSLIGTIYCRYLCVSATLAPPTNVATYTYLSLSGYTRRQEINKPDRQQHRSIAFAAHGKQIYWPKHFAVLLGTADYICYVTHILRSVAYAIIHYSLQHSAHVKIAGPCTLQFRFERL